MSWWRAEGDVNDSIDARNGTLQNGTTFTAGRYGQAFDFDGVDDSADLGTWFNLQTFTIDMWVKPGASQTAFADIIDNNHSGSSISWVIQYDNTGSVYHFGAGTSTGGTSIQFTLTPGAWQHLTITVEAGNQVLAYINGALVGSATLTAPIGYDGSQFLRLGRWGGGGRNWNGELDEVGIFNRALSAAEIQAIASGPRTIRPTSALPTITDPVIIDGYTQPGASENTNASDFNGKVLVELNGQSAGTAVGLDIAGGSTTVRGLAINGFATQEAIVLRSGDGNVITGNLLGTDHAGSVALANRGGIIIYSGSDNNTVGGVTPAARNIISGNLWNGIEINGFGGGSADNDVQGNFIGTNAAGTAALGNGIHGVYILNASGNTVGGTTANASNRIAYNSMAGVKVEGDAPQNSVLGNSIFANSGLGIDLDNNGVTPNDLGDGDSGPNNLQNFPVLTSITSSGGTTSIQGTLNSASLRKFRMEFFANTIADPSGNGEGETHLGFVDITTSTSGDASFSFTTPTPAGMIFTATATLLAVEGGGSFETSEFSAAATAQQALGTIEFSAASYEVVEGQAFAVLQVQRTGNTAVSARVDFETVDGMAGQSRIVTGLNRLEDYTTTSGTLVFRARSNVATIRVPIRDDNRIETDEAFFVQLSNPSVGNILGEVAKSQVTIHDNDPSLSFVASSSQRNEGAGGRALIEVQLTPASNKKVTVAFSAMAGTATAGVDFRPAKGTLTFQPGETRKFIEFQNINDNLYEPGNETVTYELALPRNAFIGSQATHRVTIVDDDPEPPPVDPGGTIASALFIDLQTLPRQSYLQTLRSSDREVFRVHLQAGERLALDVDPAKGGFTSQGLTASTMTILRPDGARVIATVGRSAEPDTGVASDNPAYLFQAPETGDYYIRLQTTSTVLAGYRLWFHRLGVSENVPDPKLLTQSGPMFAWYDGDDTVGITGPTGYGFTLVGPWRQETTSYRGGSLVKQTLRLKRGDRVTLKSPQGVELPLIVNRMFSIATKYQRWGDAVGVVEEEAIDLPVALDIGPVNDLLADAFGSNFTTVGLLSGEWRISLGGVVFNVFGSKDTSQAFDQLLPGVPYLRKFGQSLSAVDVTVGGFNLNQPFQSPVNLIFDPADPMLYVRGPGGPGIAASKHGLLNYRPHVPSEGVVDAGVTEFWGHIFANVPIPLPLSYAVQYQGLPDLPLSISAEFVVNIDADRDGKPLGDLSDVEDFADVLKGDFSEVREILRDIQLGANGTLSITIPYKPKDLPQVLSIDLGQASVVLNGPADTIWLRGLHQGVAFYGTPIEIGGSHSIAMEGLLDFGGNFYFVQTVSTKAAGVELSYGFTISNEGITATITGALEWSAKIDYKAGTVSGKAKASFTAEVAIEIDEDGDVHLAGSISASGKLTAKIAGDTTTLFSGSIEARVRSRGLRFKFPRGVGNIDFDLF